MMWLDTFLRCGWQSFRTIPMMAGTFLRCRRGWVLIMIVVVNLGVFFSPFAREPSPYRIEMALSLAVAVALLWLQPCFVLFLGVSNESSGTMLETVSRALWPLRVVALLDRQQTGPVRGGFALTDDLRTVSHQYWRTVVDWLADLVPLVVLDARTDRPAVVYEVGEILRRPDRLRRTLFVVGSQGEASALYAHGLTSHSPTLRAVWEDEVEAVLRRLLKSTPAQGLLVRPPLVDTPAVQPSPSTEAADIGERERHGLTEKIVEEGGTDETRALLQPEPSLAPASSSVGEGYKREARVLSLGAYLKYKRACSQLANQNFAIAEAMLKSLVEREPSFFRAYAVLAFICGAEGRYAEAEKYARCGIEVQPESGPTHYYLGAALEEQGDLNEALQEYRQALACPTDHSVLDLFFYSPSPNLHNACRRAISSIEARQRSGE